MRFFHYILGGRRDVSRLYNVALPFCYNIIGVFFKGIKESRKRVPYGLNQRSTAEGEVK